MSNDNKKKFKPTVIKCALQDSDNYADLHNALLSIPFDLISIPVYARKSLLFENHEEDTKSTIVGYVRKILTDDDHNILFEIVLYNSFAKTISEFDNLHVSISTISNKDGSLKTITKINIEA